MASGTGYNSATKPVVTFFDKEQRARLEALTFARELLPGSSPLHLWFQIAEYVVNGVVP
jgi:hypothetical protein